MNYHLQKGNRVSNHSPARRSLLRRDLAAAAADGSCGGSGAPTLRLLRLLGLVFAALLALTAAPASAKVTHEFQTEITEVPASSGAASTGPFFVPNSMTVDSGDLYVADGGTSSGRLDTFDATTQGWLSQFELLPSFGFQGQGVAVGHGTGETQVYLGGGGHESRIAVYEGAGALLGFWNGSDTPAGEFGCFECSASGDVAVDQSSNPLTEGNVYVAAPEQGVIDVFEPKPGGGEEYLTQITEREAGVPLAGPNHVAVDQESGNLIVVEGKGIDVFEPSGPNEYTLLRRIAATPAGPFAGLAGLAVDSGKGEFYAADLVNGQVYAVYEFSLAGAYIGKLAGRPGAERFPTRSGYHLAVAVDPASHRLFVADSHDSVDVIDVFGPNVVLPDVETEPATEVEPESAILNGTVNPDEAGAASCRFLWGTTEALTEAPVACEPHEVPDGNSPESVHAALPELQPDTTYYFRLQAENANGLNPGEGPQDQHFTTTGPGIRSESVSGVSSESATLEATIDPHGSPTSYFFQYGTDTVYGTEVPVPPGPSIGSGVAEVEVSNHLRGLSPATIYHYRVIARSELIPGGFEEFSGPDHIFTTQGLGAGLALPDARQWQLVSPPDKHGALPLPIGLGNIDLQASADGDAVTYGANAPVEASPEGGAPKTQVLSARTPDGWLSRDIGIPHAAPTGSFLSEYKLFSSDLSRSLVEPLDDPFQPSGSPASLSSEASEQTPYLRTNFTAGSAGQQCLPKTTPCYRPLVTGKEGIANVPLGTVFGHQGGDHTAGPEVLGAAADLKHVVVFSKVALTDAPAPAGGLYEWSAEAPPSTQLQLISVLPDDAPAQGTMTLGYGSSAFSQVPRDAISLDGSRVIWTLGNNAGAHNLYLRDLSLEKTTRLDAPRGVANDGEPRARFQGASSDGTRVFFTDRQRLTPDSNSAAGGPDLYECQITYLSGDLGCQLTDLTPLAPGDGDAQVVQSIPGYSADGSTVYFVANGALTEGEGAVRGTCEVPGEPRGSSECNLYRYDATTESTSLVAVLSGADSPDWANGELSSLEGLTARVSPNGRWLAFMSERPLTGYDNRDAVSGVPDQEVFLYHAPADGGPGGRLVCASCNPTGARPHGSPYTVLTTARGGLAGGSGVWEDSTWLAANVPGWSSPLADRQPRYLSDQGRLFFNSGDALAPQDSNGTQDVYQYEPVGIGGCSEASPAFATASDGCIALISSGTSGRESAFVDASESGDDVFFLTAANLSPLDVDSARDLYDAHACSAESPCLPEPPAPPPLCQGDACQQPATPPNDPTPGSLTFQGAGNLAECPKGKRLKVGKCFQQKAKKNKHKKSHKKHAKKRTNTNRGGVK